MYDDVDEVYVGTCILPVQYSYICKILEKSCLSFMGHCEYVCYLDTGVFEPAQAFGNHWQSCNSEYITVGGLQSQENYHFPRPILRPLYDRAHLPYIRSNERNVGYLNWNLILSTYQPRGCLKTKISYSLSFGSRLYGYFMYIEAHLIVPVASSKYILERLYETAFTRKDSDMCKLLQFSVIACQHNRPDLKHGIREETLFLSGISLVYHAVSAG